MGLTIKSIIEATNEVNNAWNRAKNFSVGIYDVLNKKTLREIKDTVVTNKNLNISNITIKLRSVTLVGRTANSRINVNFRFIEKIDIINLTKNSVSKGKIK